MRAESATEDARWALWMAAAQDGDAVRYGQLLRELEGVLRAFLRKSLGSPDLVDECLQECLFAIHKARHTYDPSRPFKPWMFALANHKTIDVLRKRGTRQRRETSVDEIPQAVDVAPVRAPDSSLDVGRALAGLDAPYREAVLLTKLAGYTVEEAADRAGVSKSAMRSRVQRGLHQLRRRLERDAR